MILLDASITDDPQSVERPAVLPQGPRQPVSPIPRIPHGEAHHRQVVAVADGADTDYIALCSCGWVSLPHLSADAAWREPCELAALYDAIAHRAALYLSRRATALTKGWV